MKQQLSQEHVAAVNRRRRVIVNFDVITGEVAFATKDVAQLVKWKFDFADA